MGEQAPRQMIKALVRGEPVGRPLLLPVVFSLGSRLENLPLCDFLANPTKIANASRQIRGTLKVDGLACYWDPFLEVEALGSTVEWSQDGLRTLRTPGLKSIEELRQRVEVAGGVAKMGRVRFAIEVVQRLKAMLKDEPALMARVTGPHTLARQLAGPSNAVSTDCLGFAAEITAWLVKSYLEAGADVVFIAESDFPKQSTGDFSQWKALLEPVVNVIRFFEALPILWFDESVSSEAREFIREQSWDCALCGLPGETGNQWHGIGPWTGVRMQARDLDCDETEFTGWVGKALEMASSQQASFFTSPDLPVTSDLKALAKNLGTIRGHLVSAV
jgi:hypothetical protein